MKPSKCDFFRDKNHLPSSLSLKGWGPPQQPEPGSKCRMHPSTNLYRGVHFSQWAITGTFIKGFVHITQPLSEYHAREGISRKSEWVLLTEEAMKAFKALKQVCISAPIWVLADYTKLFLLETDVSKDGLGAVLSQKQADGQYQPIAYGSRALMAHEKNYHSTKLKFLALKWGVTEHFREYLPYQSFVVWMDINLPMYIMSTPNLDATGH